MKLEDLRKEIINDWVMFDGTWEIDSNGTLDVEGCIMIRNYHGQKLPIKFGKVSGWFDCAYNHLTTLENTPDEVGDTFDCSYNQLTSLEGAPNTAENFWCNNNLIQFTQNDVKKVCNVKSEIII